VLFKEVIEMGRFCKTQSICNFRDTPMTNALTGFLIPAKCVQHKPEMLFFVLSLLLICLDGLVECLTGLQNQTLNAG